MKRIHVAVMAMIGALAVGCGEEGQETAGEALTMNFGDVSVKSDVPADDVIRTGVFTLSGRVLATMQWTVDDAQIAFNGGGDDVTWLDASTANPTLEEANVLAHGLWLKAGGSVPSTLAPADEGDCNPDVEQCDYYDPGPTWPFSPSWP